MNYFPPPPSGYVVHLFPESNTLVALLPGHPTLVLDETTMRWVHYQEVK